MSIYEKRAPKGPAPVCRRCKTNENVVAARNYGVPTGEWWCCGCGAHVRPDPPKEQPK